MRYVSRDVVKLALYIHTIHTIHTKAFIHLAGYTVPWLSFSVVIVVYRYRIVCLNVEMCASFISKADALVNSPRHSVVTWPGKFTSTR